MSVSPSHESLDRDSTFFSKLTYSNVLMDRGDKDNEGEESGNEEWRREGQYDTHTHTQMRREILQGGRFCGHIAHLMLGGREGERES